MLGLSGMGVVAAYLLTILSALLCVVYGINNWNKPEDTEVNKETVEEAEWERNEPQAGGKA